MGQSPTAPPSMRQTCSAWHSTDTRTARFVCHAAARLPEFLYYNSTRKTTWKCIYCTIIWRVVFCEGFNQSEHKRTSDRPSMFCWRTLTIQTNETLEWNNKYIYLYVFLSLWQGLFSSVICPGLVMTNLTYGILPSFFWTIIMPIMWLVSDDRF